MSVDLRFKPLSTFPRPMTPEAERSGRPFRAGYDDTMGKLCHELEQLGATEAYLHVALLGAQIRHDGLPYANATPSHPGVVIEAHVPGSGKLTWACDSCRQWVHNVRAIAMTLERLRLADLYDVMRGAQYRGFAALPPAGGTLAAGPVKDRDWAIKTILRHCGGFYTEADIAGGGDVADRAIRTARRSAHPDQGGSSAAFADVEAARTILTGR